VRGAAERHIASEIGDGRVLSPVLETWSRRHPPGHGRSGGTLGDPDDHLDPAPVDILDVETLTCSAASSGAADGSAEVVPRVLGVLGRQSGRLLHAVVGIRDLEEELRPIASGDDTLLAVVDLPSGPVAVVDALLEADLAMDVLGALTGQTPVHEGSVGLVPASGDVVVAVDDSLTFTAFPWPVPGGDPGVEMLMALDDAGFNHLAAPVARWSGHGLDFGVVQERALGMASGWALVETSLRDLFASGLPPADAGGDFAPEARALGVMTARMHHALAASFGVEVGRGGATVMRTHGDLHLGRTARTDQGWIVVDVQPGGAAPDGEVPRARTPLADLGDLAWSFRHAVRHALAHQPPDPEGRLAVLAEAWEDRNTTALVRGYLETPEAAPLVTGDPASVVASVRRLAGAREVLER